MLSRRIEESRRLRAEPTTQWRHHVFLDDFADHSVVFVFGRKLVQTFACSLETVLKLPVTMPEIFP